MNNPMILKDNEYVLNSLDSKPGGLLSKSGSCSRTCPLEIHYMRWGAYYPDYMWQSPVQAVPH